MGTETEDAADSGEENAMRSEAETDADAEAPVTYRLDDPVATIAMDDGSVNVLSLDVLEQLDEALDRAEADRAPVVLTGREGTFSAGFDLPVLQGGGPDAVAMLHRGFQLAERLLSFPTPVLAACTGHAMAMGAFLLLSADYRIGVAGGGHEIAVNEVALGLTLPRTAAVLCRERLASSYVDRVTLLAESFSHEEAVEAGFLDRVVPAAELEETASRTARRTAELDPAAHAASKLRVREPLLTALREAIEADHAEFQARA